jgi:hypothetical protein
MMEDRGGEDMQTSTFIWIMSVAVLVIGFVVWFLFFKGQ